MDEEKEELRKIDEILDKVRNKQLVIDSEEEKRIVERLNNINDKLETDFERSMEESRVTFLKRELGETIEFKLVHKFDTAYIGWDCDLEGWIYQSSDSKKHILLTNHGSFRLGDVCELDQQIQGCVVAIERINEAISIFKDVEK